MSEAQRKIVRVIGERNGMITFDYGLGDLAYAIELILPPDAFEVFCRENAVTVIETARAVHDNPVQQGMGLRPSDVGPRH